MHDIEKEAAALIERRKAYDEEKSKVRGRPRRSISRFLVEFFRSRRVPCVVSECRTSASNSLGSHRFVLTAPQMLHEADASLSKLEAGGLQRWRTDGRCGPKFPAPGAPAYGECDPAADEDQKGPCCRPDSGWCGNVRSVDSRACGGGARREEQAYMSNQANIAARSLKSMYLFSMEVQK